MSIVDVIKLKNLIWKYYPGVPPQTEYIPKGLDKQKAVESAAEIKHDD